MASAIVAKPSTDAPSPSDVSALITTIFTTKTSQTSLDAAYALTTLFLNSVGFRGLTSYGILDEIRHSATDKKNPGKREGAMFLAGALYERFPQQQAMSEVVFMLQNADLVPLTLDSLADKTSSVRESAQYALDALYNNLKPEASVVALLPVLITYLGKRSGKWQGTVGAYQLIGKMADKAKIGMGSKEEEEEKDVLREALGKRLEGLIPVVEAGMHDLKTEVKLVNLYYKIRKLIHA